MNIRFFNARILLIDEEKAKVSGRGAFSVLENGELHVKGERISYVGEKPEKTGSSWDREIDAKGNLLMPGFKNGHTHSGMTFLRSDADDLKLQDWLNNICFPKETLLSAEDIYYCTLLACMEYFSGGTTAVCEMYLTPDSIARATEEAGLRCVQCGGANNFSQSPELLTDWYERHNCPGSLTQFRLGIHAEYTCSKELLEKVAALAEKYHAPVYCHNSETAKEVEDCRERTGLTPTETLEKAGIFQYGGTCFHCVHMTEHDLEICRERDIRIVTNPASNLKLASGIAPVSDFLSHGLTVGIGTDGPASNNCLDMFREMFLVTGLGKYKENDASALDAEEVLLMALYGGAHAIGIEESDCLAPGKYADLIMIDLHSPNMQPLNNIGKNLVYSGSKSNVMLTMVNGKIVFEEGRFYIGHEPEEIYEAVQLVAKKARV